MLQSADIKNNVGADEAQKGKPKTDIANFSPVFSRSAECFFLYCVGSPFF
jgi:hypothetical protein